jgi:alanine racemase
MPQTGRPILTIDLGAVARNFRFLQDRLGSVGCAAAIKANCYGLGMKEVAPALFDAGCREFFVADIEEGVAARRFLPGATIYVLTGPARPDRGLYARYALSPVLNSLGQIDEWLSRAERESARPVALHFDSGMSRLGLCDAEVRKLNDDPDRLSRLKASVIMSHLACADEKDHQMNVAQRSRFLEIVRPILAKLAFRPRLSLANSSGIFLGRRYHFDLARPGAALYGLNPTPERRNPMRPVVALSARIVQVRWIDPGRTVGYGATYRSKKRTRLATISLGYADGLLRSLGGKGAVYVGDCRAPIVGRVSMDLTTIDVSDAPEQLTRPGAMVEILGPRQDADELGRLAGTIGYEVLTALGRRYQRRYLAVEQASCNR